MANLLDAIDSFLEEESNFGRFMEPALVVAIAAAAWALQDVAILASMGSEVDPIRRAYVVSMAVHALQPPLLWLLFGTVFYVLARLLGSYGRPALIYQLSGWGFITFVPAGVALAVGKYYAYAGQTVRDLGMLEEVDLSVKWNITKSLERSVAGDPALVTWTAIACLFVLASVYVWTLAIDYAMSLDRRQSALVALTPTVIYIIYVLSRVT